MAEKKVAIPLSELSSKQLLQYNTGLLEKVLKLMSDLGVAVEDLQNAVDGVAQRLLPHIQELESALEQAQADDADAAQVAADAAAAVQGIREEVDRLNALGTDPSSPVDPDGGASEEVPDVEVPADPNAPHVDNTLPGDLSDEPQVNPLDQ